MQFPSFKPRSRSGFQVAISKFQVSNQDPGQGFKLQFPSFKFQTKIQVRVSSCNFQVSSFKPRSRSGFQVAISKFQVSNQDPGQGFKLQFPSFKIHTKIQVRVSRCNFQVSRFTPRSRSGFQVAISKFQDSNQDPGQGFKLQFPSFKIHTKIQVRVSSCNFQVSSFKPRSRSGFQVAISKFQVSHQDPGQGFKLQFPSFKFQTKIQVRVPSCNFQVSSFTPRSRSGFQVAISKFQDSNQDPGQGFKLQFPSFKIQTKIQVRVSRCNFQVSRFTPRSRSGFQDAISKFQDSHQDPGQGFKLQFPSFKIQTKIQVRVSRCNFQVSRFTPRSRSGFQDAISKFQDSHQDPGQGFKMQFPSFKIQTKIQVRVSSCNFQVSRFTPRSRSGFQGAISKFQDSHQDPGQGFKVQFPSFKIQTKIQVRVSRCNFQVSRFTPRSRSGFQGAISKFQDSHQDPGQGFKVQFPSFKIQTKIQVRVSRCNFQVSRFTPRSRSGFQVAISKFQDSHQDPGQGFKVQFPSFKIQTKIQVRVSRCNFQVSRFTPRSRSGFQGAISKFQDSNQDPGQGFKLQFPGFKFQTTIRVMVSSCNFQVSRQCQTKTQVRVSSCNFQVSIFKPRSGYQASKCTCFRSAPSRSRRIASEWKPVLGIRFQVLSPLTPSHLQPIPSSTPLVFRVN